MRNYSIFDVIGPVMIGPSSSHTAGAARIGNSARAIYGREFVGASFYLHGSFQTTLEGHGSDRALVGGVLGFDTDDERLVHALEIADEMGFKYRFINEDMGPVHPNTIKVVLHGIEEDFYIIASSIGGGKIKIININGIEVEVTGDTPTIVCSYADRLGIIVEILTVLRDNNISVASLRVSRADGVARLVVSLDNMYSQEVLEELRAVDTVKHAIGIERF